MIFNDPDTLRLWLDVFFAVAAASVALAFVAVTLGIRDLRRAAPAAVVPVTGRDSSDFSPEPVRQAA
jgi:hypothetical protein